MGIDKFPRRRSFEGEDYDGKRGARRDQNKPRRPKGSTPARRASTRTVDGQLTGYAFADIIKANEKNPSLVVATTSTVETPPEPVSVAAPIREQTVAEKAIRSPELTEQLASIIHAADSREANQEGTRRELSDELIAALKAKGYSKNFLDFPEELKSKIISELSSEQVAPNTHDPVVENAQATDSRGTVTHDANEARSTRGTEDDPLLARLKTKGFSENFYDLPAEVQEKIISELGPKPAAPVEENKEVQMDPVPMGPDVDTSGMQRVEDFKKRHQFLPEMQADMDRYARTPEQRPVPKERKAPVERRVEPPRETPATPVVEAQLHEQRQASGIDMRIDELRAELDILEAEARRPGARKDIEADVLSREAELRQLELGQKEAAKKREEMARLKEVERQATVARLEAERQAAIAEERNNARKQELRARLAVLEREARSPADFPHKHDELESEVLAAEAELRELESPKQPQKAEAVIEPSVPEPKPEEVGEVISTDGIEVQESELEIPTIYPPGESPTEQQEFVSTDVPSEGTPAEMRQELASLISQFEAPATATPEKSAEQQVREYFAGRASHQEEAAKKFSWEKPFRWLGEKYNKIPFKAKLAVGAALGVGAGVVSAGVLPISFTAAYWCLGGIAAQRVAGFAGGFLKFEQGRVDSSEQQAVNKFWKWGEKEKAMGKAMLYTAGMTGAMMLLTEGVREGAQYVQQHHWGDRLHDWLGNMMGHHQTPPPPEGGVLKGSFPHSPIQEGMGERLAPEMPSVDAENGHGYEYMLKRLAQELQAKHLDASNYPESSDIHKLLAADPSNIDQVVHRIAASAEHGFYKPDGTSILVTPGAHMTIGASGEVHITNPLDTVHAPEGAHTTPAYPHAAAEAPASTAAAAEVKAEVPATGAVPPTEVPKPEVHVTGGEHRPTTPAHETTPATPEAHREFVMNKHNVPIYKGEAHFYGDASGKHAFLYSEGGGMGNQQKHDLIKEFLSRPKAPKVIYEISPMTSGGDKIKHVAWMLDPKNNMEPFNPYQEVANKFLGAFSPWKGFTGPDDFRKLIQ